MVGRRSFIGFVGDDDDRHLGVGDQSLGEAGEEEAAGGAVAVVADDDEVDAVFVGVVEQVFGGVVAFDDDVLERDADAFGAVGDGAEGLFEVLAGGIDGFGAVALVSESLGMRGVGRTTVSAASSWTSVTI